QRGYEQTSIQDIADAVMMSARTFFRYFAFKDEVLLGPVRAAQRDAISALQHVPPTATPRVALEAILTRLAQRYQQQRDGFLVRFRIVMQSPSIASLFLFTFVETEPAICTALSAHLEATTNQDDIRFLVAVYMAGLRVAIEEWLERDDGKNGEADLVKLLG